MKIGRILVAGLLALATQIGCHHAGSQGCSGGRCGLPPAGGVYKQPAATYGETATPLPSGSPYAAPAPGGSYQGSGSR
jgi:hypothetical protein